MKKFMLFAASMMLSMTVSAQVTIKIWDNATAPHSSELPGSEQVCAEGAGLNNTTQADLIIYPADKAKDKGIAVVVCPGGGYEWLAMDNEGYGLAKWLSEHGVTAAILKYRMPNHHPEVPLEDAEMAIKMMKGLAPGAEKYVCRKVGIAGSSAGGHLAAYASNLANPRPDFAILYYPVITCEPGKSHPGSFDNLLGPDRSQYLSEYYSMQNRVTAQTPPTIIAFSDADGLVPPVNGTIYYEALKAHGVQASLHIYPGGYHGWCTNPGFEYKEAWYSTLDNWLDLMSK